MLIERKKKKPSRWKIKNKYVALTYFVISVIPGCGILVIPNRLIIKGKRFLFKYFSFCKSWLRWVQRLKGCISLNIYWKKIFFCQISFSPPKIPEDFLYGKLFYRKNFTPSLAFVNANTSWKFLSEKEHCITERLLRHEG